MPRPPIGDLAAAHEIDTSSLLQDGRDDLLVLLERMIRIANSDEFRRRLMVASAFPTTDVPTFLAVNQLALHGALRPTDLAQRLETGRPNVTKIVQRLEQAGLVVRAADPEDDRGVLVALSSQGRETANTVLAQERRWLTAAVASWKPDEVEGMKKVLDRFLTDVAEVVLD